MFVLCIKCELVYIFYKNRKKLFGAMALSMITMLFMVIYTRQL
jgi:hypothetical protein